jgi:hypothetical protein
MQRIASCSCGLLSLQVDGEPVSVAVCHCIACQRRTGAPFGAGAYFSKQAVQVSGSPATYIRPTDAGHQFITYFCRTCGTSVYWRSGKNPDLVGVAVGAFADPSFPRPGRSVWEQSKHSWIDVGVVEQHFSRGRT